MSTKGRNYNPRHSLPPKKNTEVTQKEEVELKEEVTETDNDVEHVSNGIGENVNEEFQEESKEEDMDDLIEEIHQEVITNGFKEEQILQSEQEVVDKIQEILGNKGNNNPNPDSFPKDTSREENIDIVVPKGIRTRDVYEKEFATLAKAVKENLKNSDQQSNEVVYKFKMNEKTGKVEMVSPADTIAKDHGVFVDVNHQEVIGNMLRTSITEATKIEIEIFVHEEIIKDEFDPAKIQNFQRKIDTLKSNLDFINKKNAILLKLIK